MTQGYFFAGQRRLMERGRRVQVHPCPECNKAGWHSVGCKGAVNFWSKDQGAGGQARYHFFTPTGAVCNVSLRPNLHFKRHKQPFKTCRACMERIP